MTTLPRPVNADLSALSTRFDEVRSRISNAAKRSGREVSEIRLIGVVKNVEAERVRQAVALGLEHLGENRVQEAADKIAAVGRASEGRPLAWHLIGHLQRNKAARAVQLFDSVHSVDRLELAEALARHAAAVGRRLPILIEVNVSREATKFGVAPEALEPLARKLAELEGLSLDGLMTVGAPAARPEDAREGFAALRGLRDAVARSLGLELPQLSMGMSGDFEVAIEEGSTMVRVGTAIFGARGP